MWFLIYNRENNTEQIPVPSHGRDGLRRGESTSEEDKVS
jgi:hypothetical protein